MRSAFERNKSNEQKILSNFPIIYERQTNAVNQCADHFGSYPLPIIYDFNERETRRYFMNIFMKFSWQTTFSVNIFVAQSGVSLGAPARNFESDLWATE